MKTRIHFPRTVRKIENTWIPMSDGCRLAATIWLPEDAEDDPVPAILEYIPYRKNDVTAVRDSAIHPYFAGHGYAVVRIDLRGSGDSEGLLMDEYLPQEQDDALEMLSWIAARPWCTGAVGMIGISWGGFNALQIGARRPPELKAIITTCSTDDRYADDVHYMGGCVLALEMLPWASYMFAFNGLPPDPANVGEHWREIWLKRLRDTPEYINPWLTHQRRDAYWKHGSVCEDYSAITCAVYAVGGWADGYTNAIPRLLAGLPGPRKGLIGPWSHMWPQNGHPGPTIGFLQECLRWWDYWLKGIDTGVMDEPMLRAWMQESVPPSVDYAERPGRWVAEPSWPSPNIRFQTYYLNNKGLDVEPAAEARLDIEGSMAAGLNSGIWCPYGVAGDFAGDQRAEDGLGLGFTSAPLHEPVEILGFPEVILTVSVNRPQALLAVRLCDVSPTGASLLVSRGLLNLTHRDSHECPEPLEPGKQYTVTVRLNAIAHALPAGHRWRVAVSPTYWPHAWPSPEPVTLSVFAGQGSRLVLPVRIPRDDDERLRPFDPPESSAPLETDVMRHASVDWKVQHDVIKGLHQIVVTRDSGASRIVASGTEHDKVIRETYSIVENNPLSASVRYEVRRNLGRDDWRTEVRTDSTMTANVESFIVTNVLEAFEGSTRVFTKTSTHVIPRDLV